MPGTSQARGGLWQYAEETPLAIHVKISSGSLPQLFRAMVAPRQEGKIMPGIAYALALTSAIFLLAAAPGF
ncbi:MAG TPA: hypothetical protein VJ349_13890, partial [Stellaceae bacterium]|nr:hypothetical protein [Stellaceae bacterium]